MPLMSRIDPCKVSIALQDFLLLFSKLLSSEFLTKNSLMKKSYKSNLNFRKLSQSSVMLSRCSGMYFGKFFKVAYTYL